jgi:hypothetical protein
VQTTLGVDVFARHNEKRAARQHLLENVPDRVPGTRTDFIRLNLVAVLLMKVVFQVTPHRAVPVADKIVGGGGGVAAGFSKRVLSASPVSNTSKTL